jgi:hypothetical protein
MQIMDVEKLEKLRAQLSEDLPTIYYISSSLLSLWTD